MARAADNETEVCSAGLNTFGSSDNTLNAKNSGCRVRGARDSGLTYSDKDIQFGNYQIPENWDQEAVVHALTKVCIRLLFSTTPDWDASLLGWWLVPSEGRLLAWRRLGSQGEDLLPQPGWQGPKVSQRWEAVLHDFPRQNTNHQSQDEKHNNFNGMVWALFNKGKIFEKMAQHPVILNTSNIIIGETSAVSSLAANTVLPGNGGIKRNSIDANLTSPCRTTAPPGLPLLQDAVALLQPPHHGRRSPNVSPVCHPPYRLQLWERRHCLQAQLSPQAPLPGQQGGLLQERHPDLRQGRRHDPVPRGSPALCHAQQE